MPLATMIESRRVGCALGPQRDVACVPGPTDQRWSTNDAQHGVMCTLTRLARRVVGWSIGTRHDSSSEATRGLRAVKRLRPSETRPRRRTNTPQHTVEAHTTGAQEARDSMVQLLRMCVLVYEYGGLHTIGRCVAVDPRPAARQRRVSVQLTSAAPPTPIAHETTPSESASSDDERERIERSTQNS
jgi:hypothetical protein